MATKHYGEGKIPTSMNPHQRMSQTMVSTDAPMDKDSPSHEANESKSYEKMEQTQMSKPAKISGFRMRAERKRMMKKSGY